MNKTRLLFLVMAVMMACTSLDPPLSSHEVWHTEDTWGEGTCSVTPDRYSRLDLTTNRVDVILSGDPGIYSVSQSGDIVEVVTNYLYNDDRGYSILTHVEASFVSVDSEVFGTGLFSVALMVGDVVISNCYRYFNSSGYVEWRWDGNV